MRCARVAMVACDRTMKFGRKGGRLHHDMWTGYLVERVGARGESARVEARGGTTSKLQGATSRSV
eukprot:m.11193 g.11193  ORF g.11193 m.11193 type:complete len:65 (-) comp8699_c0_seq1:165-359(-)